MEVVTGFNNIDIHLSPDKIPGSEYCRPVRGTTQSAELDELSVLKQTGEYFRDLDKELDVQLGNLALVKKEGLLYAKDKKKEHAARVQDALKNLEMFFMDSHYRGTQMGEDAGFGDAPVPYTFRVMTGPHMDQWENFRLGTGSSWQKKPELMKYEALGLDSLDITQPSAQWVPVVEKAEEVFRGEQAKIRSYLKRLDFITACNEVREKMESEYWSYKQGIVFEDLYNADDKMLDTAKGYTDITLSLLEEIKRAAEKNKERLKAKQGNADLVFHVNQIIDEMDRMASHCTFNGMNLLTGRFSPESPYKEFVLVPAYGERGKVSIIIPNMIANTLCRGVFPVNGWEIKVGEAFASDLLTDQVVQGCREKILEIKKIQKEVAAAKEQLQRLRGHSLSLELAARSQEKILSISKQYGIPQKTGVSPKAGSSVTEQTLVYLVLMYHAYDEAFDCVAEIRMANQLLGNSVVDGEQKQRLLQKAVSALARLDRITSKYRFAGASLFDGADKYGMIQKELLLDSAGTVKKTITLYRPSSKSLELQASDRYDPWMYSMENANMEIGRADSALASLRMSRDNVFMVIESGVVLEDIIPNKAGAGKPEYNDQSLKNELSYSKAMQELLAEAAAFAYAAESSLYNYRDRDLVSRFCLNMFQDLSAVVARYRELCSKIQQMPGVKKQVAEAYAAKLKLLGDLERMYTGALNGPKGLQVKIGSAGDAEALLLLITSLQKKHHQIASVK